MNSPAPTKTREAELQYLKEERDRLCSEEPVNQVDIDILTDRICEILNEAKRRALCY